MKLQRFAGTPTNTTVVTDIAPAIAVDHVVRMTEGIKKLQEVLGIIALRPLPEGNAVKIYKYTTVNTPSQVAEGEEIARTEIKRELDRTITLAYKKYRRNTSLEAIQANPEIAINDLDGKLLAIAQKGIHADFFSMLSPASGSTSVTGGADLQETLANIWGEAHEDLEDFDSINMVYFVNPKDISAYLGTATVSTQTAFGFDYMQNFLGLGDVIVTNKVEQGTIKATPKENLNGVYASVGGTAYGVFDLTTDATGIVGIGHSADLKSLSYDSVMVTGIMFYPEVISAIFDAEINPQ